ncbi:MAG TPA: valine--tRNA ligase [Terriglobales bacterium]|jgi:valyl-tRNA synthetase|nr:valine--tRNA ligase [Terriglobales bacterium]
MPHDLPKAYEPGAIEARWAEFWVNEKLFSAPNPEPGDSRPRFSLLLPPPNVTGRLHMGHMLNQTQMDIIVRWHRMRGFLTLWLPGTDHASIATQMMVERQLATEKKRRQDLGRDAFIERVWCWKRHYGGAILEQMKRLGASVDWDREYFTLDENLSRAVREAFVRLYEEGLIYRGKYIVNWCPRCGTAISDLEVKHEEAPGKLYEIRYPVVGSDEFITVATTRPETMLGDTAVAVNEKDERYKHLHGKKVRLPLMNREIPIITDEVAQPEFGTGAVKITPSHDANDFEAGLRHNLPQIDVMDERAKMNSNAGPYAGLDRSEARDRVLNDLREQGFLVAEKDYTVALAKCDRCGTVVEPRLSLQWFLKVEPLAKRAIEVVEKGYIHFKPENYKQIYLNWMCNIHDWCISRQLWWGERIPAWCCLDCGETIVARDSPSQCTKCSSGRLEQDPDVLDTWFSSGQLPFTALGWPEATADLAAFYPTSLLITGFDILFLWVARGMIMLSCWFMSPPHRPLAEGEKPLDSEAVLRESVPFREVYIHALVRDADRQKMSKTKGNVLDPIEVIEKYGTDATRFTLASMSSPGTDIAFNPSRTEGYRAFANKIWNAARFMFMNVDRIGSGGVANGSFKSSKGISGFAPVALEDRWILSRFNRVAGGVDTALRAYRFDDAARAIYDFFWGELCDWYIELIKPRLLAEGEADGKSARASCANLVLLFEASLRLLHPIMPFITEEIWHAIYDGEPPLRSIALAAYPQIDSGQVDGVAENDISILQDVIINIRNLRAELKVEQKVKVPVQIYAADSAIRTLIQQNQGAIERLANVDSIAFSEKSLANLAGARGTTRFDVLLIYEKKIDAAVERERLRKDLDRYEKEISNGQRQLQNEQFLAKAPKQVVEGIRKRAEELEILIRTTRSKLDGL